MKEVIEPGAMSDNDAIRYRLEALGWKRKYRKLQTETAERLEKLDEWMYRRLWQLADQYRDKGAEQVAEEVERIGDAIYHAIGEDDE